MTPSQLRQLTYAAMSPAGLAATWYFNATYAGPRPYLAAWFANSASSSAAIDLIIVALTSSVFILAESRRLNIRLGSAYVLAAFALALAFALPLFLLIRERALNATAGTSTGSWRRG